MQVGTWSFKLKEFALLRLSQTLQLNLEEIEKSDRANRPFVIRVNSFFSSISQINREFPPLKIPSLRMITRFFYPHFYLIKIVSPRINMIVKRRVVRDDMR